MEGLHHVVRALALNTVKVLVKYFVFKFGSCVSQGFRFGLCSCCCEKQRRFFRTNFSVDLTTRLKFGTRLENSTSKGKLITTSAPFILWLSTTSIFLQVLCRCCSVFSFMKGVFTYLHHFCRKCLAIFFRNLQQEHSTVRRADAVAHPIFVWALRSSHLTGHISLWKISLLSIIRYDNYSQSAFVVSKSRCNTALCRLCRICSVS